MTFALPLAPVKCHDSLPIIVNVTREVEGSLLSVDFEDEHAYHPIKIDGKMIVRQYDATHWTLPGLLDNTRLTNFSKHYKICNKICNTCTIWYRAHLKAQDRAEIPFAFLFVFLVLVKASQEVEKEYSESSTAIANTGKSADSIPDSDQTPTATRNKQPALPAGKSVCRHGVYSLSKRCLPSSSLKMSKSSEKILCEEKSNGPNHTATHDESDVAHNDSDIKRRSLTDK